MVVFIVFRLAIFPPPIILHYFTIVVFIVVAVVFTVVAIVVLVVGVVVMTLLLFCSRCLLCRQCRRRCC